MKWDDEEEEKQQDERIGEEKVSLNWAYKEINELIYMLCYAML